MEIFPAFSVRQFWSLDRRKLCYWKNGKGEASKEERPVETEKDKHIDGKDEEMKEEDMNVTDEDENEAESERGRKARSDVETDVFFHYCQYE